MVCVESSWDSQFIIIHFLYETGETTVFEGIEHSDITVLKKHGATGA